MDLLNLIFLIIQCWLAFQLAMPFLLLLIKWFTKQYIKRGVPSREADYAVIITAYEDTLQIPYAVDSILKSNYTNFLIYVVADHCDVSTLAFSDNRVIVLRPEEKLASNIRSHFYAIERFHRDHERLTIIDSDNLVHPDYFIKLNEYFDAGYVAVQGVRKAKNLNTAYACLDEAGDMYYRFVDRKLLFETGSSASLAGSGMAFSTACYRQTLQRHVNRTGAGFDKLLQYGIVNSGLRIAFAEQAVVYDEKTTKSDQLVKQRARWINTWFKFAVLGVKMIAGSIVSANYNKFAFSLMLLRPPLFMLLGFAFVAILFNVWMMLPMTWIWLVSLAGFTLTFLKSLRYFQADARVYGALRMAPVFVFHQVLALLRAKRANELSVATKHEQQIDIREIKAR